MEEEKLEDDQNKSKFTGILGSIWTNGTINYEIGGNTIDTRAASLPSTPNALEESN